MSIITLVVPCYNEAGRLDVHAFKDFAQSGVARLLLVNDGSRDNTLEVLRGIASVANDRVTVLDLQPNGGKAEAVRRGMLRAVEEGADYVGFWDADLATPFEALSGFIEQLDSRPSLDVVMGSRVRLLGRTIDRHATRHYSGRVFATAASMTLRLPVYDTQCGAKLFRVGPRLNAALQSRFLSRWIFDVELLARLGTRDGRYSPNLLFNSVYELPLTEWRDVAGSKLKTSDFFKSGLDLVKIFWRYTRVTAGPVTTSSRSARSEQT
jgi:glycosyltransferase involved in cell wall biosynthesis